MCEGVGAGAGVRAVVLLLVWGDGVDVRAVVLLL